MQKTQKLLILIGFFLVCATFPAVCGQLATEPFVLKFVDAATGRPVPLVEVEAFNGLRLVSDNLGHIAIQEPDLCEFRLRLVIRGNGYRYPQLDLLGERAVSLQYEPGKHQQIKLERTAAAERLYRITGAGRYRDSVLAGIQDATIDNRLFGKVIGLDSAIPVMWRGRLFCFWGDTLCTDRLILSGSGALIRPGRSPEVPPKVLYFSDEDRYALPMLDTGSPGFVWIETVLPLNYGRPGEVLAARYVKHKTLEEAVETGFAIFRQSQRRFTILRRFKSGRHHKSAHAVQIMQNEKPRWAIQPWEITEPELKSFMNPDSYLNYSCLEKADAKVDAKSELQIEGRQYRVRRDHCGRPLFAWVQGGVPCHPLQQKVLRQAGLLKSDESWLQLTEVGSGKTSPDFSGSISWNNFRNRWVMISQGHTGEIWYAEADTFTGPWFYARRIVEHDTYNFYNPVHHPWFDQNGGRTLFFEGTYTSFFTRDGYKTPRADYNQVMYRLDLSHPHLLLPQPIYRVETGPGRWRLLNGQKVAAANLWSKVQHVEFCAFTGDLDGIAGLQPVYDHAATSAGRPDLQTDKPGLQPADNGSEPVFYSLRNASAAAELEMSADLVKTESFGLVFPATSRLLTLSPEIAPR